MDEFQEILEHYGPIHQIGKLLEEVEELHRAIEQYIDPGMDCQKCAEDALIDEIADVSILIEQVVMFLGIEKVNQRVDFKLNRQINRIKKESNTDYITGMKEEDEIFEALKAMLFALAGESASSRPDETTCI